MLTVLVLPDLFDPPPYDRSDSEVSSGRCSSIADSTLRAGTETSTSSAIDSEAKGLIGVNPSGVMYTDEEGVDICGRPDEPDVLPVFDEVRPDLDEREGEEDRFGVSALGEGVST